MKKIIISTLAAATLLVASNTEYKYEVTPMIGKVTTNDHVDIKDHNTYGVTFGINRGDDCKFDQIELAILHTNGAEYDNSTLKTDITRLFVNGVKEYNVNNKFKLFALAGLGYEDIDNSLFSNNDDKFFNYGVGFKYALTGDSFLRADVRHLLKFDGDRNIVYTLGLSIPFGENSKNTKSTEVKTKKIEKTMKIKEDTNNNKDDIVAPIIEKPKAPAKIKTVVSNKVDTVTPTVLSKPETLGVVFATNSAIIKSSYESKFTKYVNYLNKVSTASVIVEGHTDSIGSQKSNQVLSEKRANSAKAKLVDMGVNSARIEAIGYGEKKPLVKNDTEENRQINRRVTARIVK